MTSIHMVPADDPASVESFLRGKRGPTLAERKALQRFRCPDCSIDRKVIYLNPTRHDMYAGKPLTCPECGSRKNPVPGRGRFPLEIATLLHDLASVREAGRDPPRADRPPRGRRRRARGAAAAGLDGREV
jgi:DNA-directed RNA polymerase subunit RPC12/RpoP